MKKRCESGRSHRLSKTPTPKQDIHFLQRQPLRLRHDQPNEQKPAHTPQQPEKDERPIRNLFQHLRRDLAHNEVTHPIARRP